MKVVPFDVAMKLKEKLFNDECTTYYFKNKRLNDDRNVHLWSKCKNFYTLQEIPVSSLEYEKSKYYPFIEHYPGCTAPDYTEALEWLEKQGIFIELLIDGWGKDECVSEEHICYRLFIWKIGEPKPNVNEDYGALRSRTEILDFAIKEACKLF